MFKTIGICGCGWLGFPLAQQLINSGYTVLGTSRSDSKLKLLSEQRISAHRFTLGEPLPWSANPPQVLVLNLPPGRRQFDELTFVSDMTALIQQATEQQSKILFVSSTSVYGEVAGEITETQLPLPQTASAQAHVILEQQVLESGQGSVLRLAGLIGPERHPVKQLSGRALDKGEQKVNLVHLQDVITVIAAIIQQEQWQQLFHLSATGHPSRADFYNWAAVKAGLPPPQFSQEITLDEGRWINAEASLKKLGVRLQYPSPFDMPIELN
ncbi:SDR family oxidoreductase [Bowmanella sp. Y26]|uniref:SDR family oxidoreductase n=1 Tax=Bowmanella yangjiangensis TaxID=2811230 RepID=UPI001BDC8F3A|nr:SDR family oxidoreductase [Bowmanella yangjiangensis]MBT1066095.1 SDR family oxidoreductase [Bowmanella yangjiangensis]